LQVYFSTELATNFISILQSLIAKTLIFFWNTVAVLQD
jgi:hypothetical protein